MLDARPWPASSNQGHIHLDTLRNTYIELESEMIERTKARGFELYTSHFETCPARERTAGYQQTFGPEEKGIYEYTN